MPSPLTSDWLIVLHSAVQNHVVGTHKMTRQVVTHQTWCINTKTSILQTRCFFLVGRDVIKPEHTLINIGGKNSHHYVRLPLPVQNRKRAVATRSCQRDNTQHMAFKHLVAHLARSVTIRKGEVTPLRHVNNNTCFG